MHKILNEIIKKFPKSKHAFSSISMKASKYEYAGDFIRAIHYYEQIPQKPKSNSLEVYNRTGIQHSAFSGIWRCLFKLGKNKVAYNYLMELFEIYSKEEPKRKKNLKSTLRSKSIILLPILIDGKSQYFLFKQYFGARRIISKKQEKTIKGIPIQAMIKQRFEQKKHTLGIRRYCGLDILFDNEYVSGIKYAFTKKKARKHIRYEFVIAENEGDQWKTPRKIASQISLLFAIIDSLSPEDSATIFGGEKYEEPDEDIEDFSKSIRTNGIIDTTKLKTAIEILIEKRPKLAKKFLKWF